MSKERVLFGPDGQPLTAVDPLTIDYRPSMTRSSFYWYDQLPQFSLFTVDRMLLDYQVRFGLKMLNGPCYGAEIEFTCDNKAVSKYVSEQWQRLWSKSARQLLGAKRYGYAGFEVLYAEHQGELVIEGLRDFHPWDCKPLTFGQGQLAGVTVQSLYGEGRGNANLMGMKGLWITTEREFGRWFGQSCLEASYPAWWEKRMRGGAFDLRRLRMFKDAWTGDVIGYPIGKSYTLPSGEVVHARDIAREIADTRAAGGAIMKPNSYTPEGKDEWTYQAPTGVSGASQILEYVDDLDMEVWKGMGVVAEAIEAAETGSGFSGRSIPFMAFLASREEEMTELLYQVKEQTLDGMVLLKFGQKIPFNVKVKPLIETHKQQGEGGGAPQQPPQPTMFNMPRPQPGREPTQLSAEAKTIEAHNNEADRVARKGTTAGALIADDLATELVSRLKKNDLGPESLTPAALGLDELVDRATGMLESALFEHIFASNVMGANDVLDTLPAGTFASGSGEPPVPPIVGELLSDGDDDPEIQLTGLQNAIDRLTEARVVAPEEFYAMARDARQQAFTVSGEINQQTRESLREIVGYALTEGETLDTFVDRVQEALPNLPLSESRLELVFRQNLNESYTQGMNQILDHPVVDDGFPYRAYYPIHDSPRVRQYHLALESTGIDGTNFYHKDDPVWRLIQPPNDWNCRCGWAPISASDAAYSGLREAIEWEASGIEPMHKFVKLPSWILDEFRKSGYRQEAVSA